MGKTRRYRVQNEEIRANCQLQSVKEWVSRRRNEWNEHVERMGTNRRCEKLEMVCQNEEVLVGSRKDEIIP